MKLFLLLLSSSIVFAADWDAVQRIPAAQKIEVIERSGGGRLRATLVSTGPDAVVIREASGERSIARADIRELRVFDPSRRIHRGLLWTLVGAGAGAGASLAACTPRSRFPIPFTPRQPRHSAKPSTYRTQSHAQGRAELGLGIWT